VKYNVDFLQEEFPFLYEVAMEAEKHVFSDPRTSIFYSRHTLERAVHWLYDHDDYLQRPEIDSLHELLLERTFQENLSPGMGYTLDFIHRVGNRAIYSEERLSSTKAKEVFRYLFNFLAWIYTYYGKDPIKELVFDEEILKSHSANREKEKSIEELKKLGEVLQEKEKSIRQLQKENEELRKRIKENNPRTRKHIKNIYEYSEAETRSLLIDELLSEAGWSQERGNMTREYLLKGLPTKTGNGYADYVLWSDTKLPYAVVEAKRTSSSAKEGYMQAVFYADSLEKQFGIRPIVFLTNGFKIYIAEEREDYPREIHGFYTQDQLERIIQRRSKKQPLHSQRLNKQIAGRYYQEEAIRRTTETFESGKRRALLVMATGTGKTRTAVSLVDVLMRSEWVKKVLFLADRRELVSQAFEKFAEFLPHQPSVNMLRDKYDISANIYFSTYKTMMNALEQRLPSGQKQFNVGSFDLVIVDEAHRSVYKKYGMLFEYFDALLVGLTATPKSDIDKNTYRIFELEDNKPTYAYEYQRAVDEGYLVPAVPISVETKFLREGIHYDQLSEEDKEIYEETFMDPLTEEMPKSIEKTAINDWLFNEDTIDNAWKVVMEKGIKINGGDEIGKTIIFARNHPHAEFIVERFYKLYGKRYSAEFCQVIDNYTRNAEELLKAFKNPDKYPRIAVSVDMLDTGIDIPEIVNLVILKPVYSKAKFWQMIGRGTRTRENLFGPGLDKKEFYVFDFCKNIEFFKAFPKGKEAKQQVSISQKIMESKARIIFELGKEPYKDDEELQQYRATLIQEMVASIKALDKTHFTVRPALAYVLKYENESLWDSLLEEELREIITHITPLLVIDEKDTVKRLDYLLYEMQRSIVEGKGCPPNQVKRLQEVGRRLEKKRTIDEIKAKIDLIRAIQKKDFFEHVSIATLEEIRKELRDLMQYMDRDDREPLYINLSDEVTKIEMSELPIQSDYQEYHQSIRAYLERYRDHVSIQKIRMNKQLTETDLRELEKILFQGRPETEEEFRKHFKKDEPLTVLIRELIGLDVNAAKEAFSEFLKDKTLNANQIDFVNTIIDFFVSNGRLDPKKLFQEQPFTGFHPNGVVGIFPDKNKRLKLLQVIHSINKRAEVLDIS
jgi:type I restriction enzyme, R subunit